MDLRSGHAFWPLKNGITDTYPALAADETCDVAVLGAGVTGALIADALTAEGANVVVLDKRDAGTGSTAASTALLQYEIDTELLGLIAAVGEAAAVRSYRVGLEAIDRIEAKIRTFDDPCDFACRPSLYLASTRRDARRLEIESAARTAHGFDVEYLDAKRLGAQYPFPGHGAILSRGDAELDPHRFTHALLRAARRRGARIYDRTEVTKVKAAEGGHTLRTDRGPTVRARRVVFATGYESQEYLRRSPGDLSATFAAISEPITPFPEWPDRCLVWETARPYCYLRATADDRILIGGGDVAHSAAHKHDRLIARKVEMLEKKAAEWLPGVAFETAFAWAGTFGTTPDGLAYIGRPPEWPEAYFALGYGGNGITMSAVAAKIIADDFLGRPNPDAEVFRFGR